MANETTEGVVDHNSLTGVVETEQEFKSLDEALAHINKLKADKALLLDEKHQVKRKLTKFEEEAQQRDAQLLAEQGKYKELYEQTLQKSSDLENRIKDNSINNAVREALKEAGARSVDTVMKLVDKTSIEFDSNGNISLDSVKAVVDSIKKADSVLFDGARVEPPGVKRASEGPVEGSFEKEVANARTQAELKQIMAKYASKL